MALWLYNPLLATICKVQAQINNAWKRGAREPTILSAPATSKSSVNIPEGIDFAVEHVARADTNYLLQGDFSFVDGDRRVKAWNASSYLEHLPGARRESLGGEGGKQRAALSIGKRSFWLACRQRRRQIFTTEFGVLQPQLDRPGPCVSAEQHVKRLAFHVAESNHDMHVARELIREPSHGGGRV